MTHETPVEAGCPHTTTQNSTKLQTSTGWCGWSLDPGCVCIWGAVWMCVCWTLGCAKTETRNFHSTFFLGSIWILLCHCSFYVALGLCGCMHYMYTHAHMCMRDGGATSVSLQFKLHAFAGTHIHTYRGLFTNTGACTHTHRDMVVGQSCILHFVYNKLLVNLLTH